MNNRSLLYLSVLLILLGAALTALADVPQLINYQGVLLGSGGQPVTVPTTVLFAIWDDPTAGDSLWSEEQLVSPDGNGVFSVLLGSVSPIPDSVFTGYAYLSVKVGADPEMTPRSRLVSAGYAYRVASVDGASGGTILDELVVTGPGDDSVRINPVQIVIRGPGGDQEAVYAANGMTYSGSGNALTVNDSDGDVRVTISVDEDGGAITLYESTATQLPGEPNQGGRKVEFREGGVLLYGTSETDTVCHLLPSGNIFGKGQLAMGDSHGASGDWSNVTGYDNEASGDSSVVCGGYSNTASGRVSAIVGGHNNTASGNRSFVGAGMRNTASHDWSAVVGGNDNTASGERSFIGGGDQHVASGSHTTISGGYKNTATTPGQSTIGGGRENHASNLACTIGGGRFHLASGFWSTVAGGDADTASGDGAAVGGGQYNVASGSYGMVPGGYGNEAGGAFAFAAGRRAKATHSGTFVWADLSDFDFPSIAFCEFAARCTAGVRFVTGIDGNGAATAGVQVAGGGGSWSSISDRNLKENFSPVDADDILAKLAAIPINTWNYKAQDESVRHIGPMAQDVYAAFGVGEDDRHITTIDADGIALAAIQALDKKTRKIEELEDKVARLEAVVQQLLEEWR